MNLTVPTVMVDAIVTQEFEENGKKHPVGEVLPLPYGPALQLRAMGVVGAFKDEIEKHLEANELVKIYGADAWFPFPMQTIKRVGDYLALQAKTETTH